jgi:UTP--glucose-1-phosphate uridylyltransferase
MEMQSFFYLFTRYLTEKAKSQELYVLYDLDDCHCTDIGHSEWDRIKSPAADQIVPYDKLPKVTSPDALNKLAVLKVNGGLGTSMGVHYSDFIRPVVNITCQQV